MLRRLRTPSGLLPLLCLSLAASTFSSAETVWVEAESAVNPRMAKHPWYGNQVKKDRLSGGEWLSNFGDEPGSAECVAELPADGTWTLWLRANPVASGMEVRVDSGEWRAVDFTKARGQQNIADDDKPDLRFIAWVGAGAHSLKAGKHTIAFRTVGGPSNHGGVDCLVLTNDGFIPQGITHPDARPAAGPDVWFPLLAGGDPVSPDSVIDLSSLNPAPAGRFGAVTASGKNLVFASDSTKKPVKFWGVNANQEQGGLTREESLKRIAWLRANGVNIVRQHTVFDEVTTDGRIDPKKLAEFDWWFSELKKAGIYMDWSVFYHFPVREGDGYPKELFAELEPMGGKNSGLRDTYGIITVSPELQNIRRKVMLELLNHKNAITGLRYAEDPALDMVEFQNEDSVFFWNPLGDLVSPQPKRWPLHAARLRQQWCAWAKAKYSSDEKLKAAWGGLDGESLAKGELSLMGPYELDTGGIRGSHAGRTARAGDQLRFLAEMQSGFFRKCEAAVRAAGFKGLTITTNWQGGSSLTEQTNLWTDNVGSMIDRHTYFGGGAGGHGIQEGKVSADSNLSTPGDGLFQIALRQMENKPFSITEWTMSPPNQWKLEAAPIIAFYGLGLQGWDASFHFAQSGMGFGEGWPRMTSYATDTPHYLGQFPALAFAVLKGHFQEGPPVAARRVKEERFFSGQPAWLEGKDGGTPFEAFAAGRVTVDFTGQGKSVNEVDRWRDAGAKTIRSATGELTWDYGQGRILVHSPKTQGVIGHPGRKPVKLPAVKVECLTEFVSLILTPLDDQPLAQSHRILITALARDKQTGARYSTDGTVLEAAGTPPLLLEPVQATIRLAGAPPVSVRPLDHRGVPKAGSGLKAGPDGSFHIDGTSEAYLYEVRR
ncbi:MAG: Endo-beta-mannanase [Verrucomicrobiales bacterium]|nr:Endo-beta-mannanase [Verrucomicrobiales bacterium]